MPAPTALRAELAAAFAPLQAHLLDTIVPMWEGPGWNPTLGLAFEALDAQHQVLPVQRYRAMACARQLYLFSNLPGRPGAAQRSDALFQSLRRFHDPLNGGWFYSLDADGQPLDRSKDLYTHAFIVFASAHYLMLTRSAAAQAQLDAALRLIDQHFASADGLYHAALGEQWQSLGQGPLQNPLMHLAEALIAAQQASPTPHTAQALLRLCDAMHAQFIDPTYGVLMEKPCTSHGNWFEPGHQFEWYYLLKTSPLLHAHPLCLQLEASFAYSERIGVAQGEVLAMLAADGTVSDPTRRIWAQAEYLRALTVREGAAPQVLAQLEQLRAHYIRPAGWFECRDAQGEVSRHDMPATTPYHLATAFAALSDYVR